MSEENSKPVLPEAPKVILPEAPKAPASAPVAPKATVVLPEAPKATVAPVAPKPAVTRVAPSMVPPTPIVVKEKSNPLFTIIDFASAAVCVAFAVMIFFEM